MRIASAVAALATALAITAQSVAAPFAETPATGEQRRVQQGPPPYEAPPAPPRHHDGPITLDVAKPSDRWREGISFPPGAKQEWSGDGEVYVMEMNLAVALAPDSGPGSAVVSGVVDGCGAVQVEIRAPSRDRGSGTARWNTTGFLEGTRLGSLGPDGKANLELANYLPECSVSPGPTTLEWTLERYGDIQLRRAVILPGSGIRRTSVRPAQLNLRPQAEASAAERGEPFELGFSLENEGDLAARDVSVTLRSLSSDLRILGPRRQDLGSVEGGVTGSFKVIGQKLGSYQLRLGATSSNANRPVLAVTLPVAAAVPDGDGFPWWILPLVTVALLLVAAWRLLRRY